MRLDIMAGDCGIGTSIPFLHSLTTHLRKYPSCELIPSILSSLPLNCVRILTQTKNLSRDASLKPISWEVVA